MSTHVGRWGYPSWDGLTGPIAPVDDVSVVDVVGNLVISASSGELLERGGFSRRSTPRGRTPWTVAGGWCSSPAGFPDGRPICGTDVRGRQDAAPREAEREPAVVLLIASSPFSEAHICKCARLMLPWELGRLADPIPEWWNGRGGALKRRSRFPVKRQPSIPVRDPAARHIVTDARTAGSEQSGSEALRLLLVRSRSPRHNGRS